MCGIAGRINYRTGQPVQSASLAAMCDLVRHRGPDGHGLWTDGAVGFGHRRLSIIDLSPAGKQPMSTADGRLTITFNGEIYNFETLREELVAKGHRFRSRTDTEVILHAYDAWGEACLSRLRGMFAFAIWDAPRRRLFAARDRAGKKPFYYREDRDGLAFASEPKAFLGEPSFNPQVNPDALFQYLSFQYVPGPLSAFDGVRRLPPAHYLVLENGTIRIERYWRLRYSPKPPVSEAQAEEQALDLLRDATRARLVSDVPLGAFLSGGVDSSLVVALMAEAGGQVKTFSIGFEESEYNELPYSRIVAQRFGTDHHEAIVRPDALSILPRLIWHYNEPYADSSAIPTMYLSEMTRRHVTVALNGDAGDENFAGYTRYRAALLAHRLDVIPLGIRKGIAALTQGPAVRHPLVSRARRFLQTVAHTPERRYAQWMFHFSDAQKQELCTPEFLRVAGARHSSAHLERLFDGTANEDFLDATLQVDVDSYLPDDLLVKVDIATMAHGLEGRSPFLDHNVMQFAASLPRDLKLRGSETKYLLKKIARRLVPVEVVDRPKKGFGVPLDHWFRGELNELAHDVLLGHTARSRGYFNVAFVERLLAEHEQGLHNWHYQLWNLLVFELWHQMFIDARPHEAPSGIAVQVAV